MSTNLSVAQILAKLESQLSFHREKEAFHAQQEALHRDERTRHAAEIEQLSRHYEAFKTVAATAADLATRAAVPPPAPDVQDRGPGGRLRLSRVVDKIATGWPAGEPFGMKAVAQEAANRMQEPINTRLVSIALRRLSKRGRLRRVRKGRPHWEALYVREE